MEKFGLSYQRLKKTVESKGYKFFENGALDVNIFGVRFGYDVVNEFNDIVGVAYKDEFGNEVCLAFKATTKPGLYWLKNKLMNKQGTFIMMPGQYRSCWYAGLHGKTRYPALRQNGKNQFKGWRDNDSDGKFDVDGPIYSDAMYVNGHTTSFKNDIDKVGPYSAGCQVIQDSEEFKAWLAVIYRSMESHGDKVSYTLLESKDFENG